MTDGKDNLTNDMYLVLQLLFPYILPAVNNFILFSERLAALFRSDLWLQKLMIKI